MNNSGNYYLTGEGHNIIDASVSNILAKAKPEIIERVKHKLKTGRDSISIIKEAKLLIDEKQLSDPDYTFRITGDLTEDISKAIIKDNQYERTAKDRDYYISFNNNYKKLTWHEKYPVAYEYFKAILTALLALVVGIILWYIDNQKKDQEFDKLKNKVENLTIEVDSLKRKQSNK